MPNRLAILLPLAGALAVSACTVHQAEQPALTGPSELSLSIAPTATPDSIAEDGVSQSSIAIVARDQNGKAISGLGLQLAVTVAGASSNFGSLSAHTVFTGSDGRASAVYTAPLAVPFLYGGPPTIVDIAITPIGNNYQVSAPFPFGPRTVSIKVTPPPVPVQSPTAPIAAVTFSPTSPKVGDLITFDASASIAGPGHHIVAYYWSFGDSQPNDEHGSDASHVYVAAGSYMMVLGVIDEAGQVSSTFQTIVVTK